MELLELFSFDDTGWGDDLLFGAFITVQLAVYSIFGGLFFGLLLTGCKVSKNIILEWFANIFVLIVRGTPEFLILLLIYFGVEILIQNIIAFFNFDIVFNIPKILAATIGLTVIFSAYACEVFRGAYLAVPKGQIEAAFACGMSSTQVFIRIRLPQMWRFAIPGLGNLWMVLLKDTSLAAVLALDELLRQAKVAGENTRDPLTFYIAAGLIYLTLTGVSDIGRHWLEKRSRVGV